MPRCGPYRPPYAPSSLSHTVVSWPYTNTVSLPLLLASVRARSARAQVPGAHNHMCPHYSVRPQRSIMQYH